MIDELLSKTNESPRFLPKQLFMEHKSFFLREKCRFSIPVFCEEGKEDGLIEMVNESKLEKATTSD